MAHAGARRAPGTALELGLAPFVIGDTLKRLLAAGLLPAGWRLTKK